MELYLIKSAVILTILYGFYKLVLENESMHIFKRFYLLGSLPVAFLIPLITFTSYVEVPVSSTPVLLTNSFPMAVAVSETSVNLWPFVIWGLYALGVVFFAIKFGKNLNQLISKIKNNPKVTHDSINHILLKTPVVPHTFFNYVFLNKQKFEAREIPDEVIAHEHVHAKQKHSIDILLIELLQIAFWFNPLLYFLKRSIKLNHEFLADRAVLSRGIETAAYQNLLLAFSSHATTPALANSINYSFIKKRFTVMKKQTSTQAIWLRSLLLVPLLALLMYSFSTKKDVVIPQNNTINVNKTIQAINIYIDQDSEIYLNGIAIAFNDIPAEVNKLNTHLTIEEKQKYVRADIAYEKERDLVLATEISKNLFNSNIWQLSVLSMNAQRNSNLKHPTNETVGMTVEEAEIHYQEMTQKRAKQVNEAKNPDNPWRIEISEMTIKNEKQNIVFQEKATKAEVKEYNTLVKRLNKLAKEDLWENIEEIQRVKFLYQKMTVEQRKNAEPYPEIGVIKVPNIEISDTYKDRWVKDFDNSFQQEKAPSQSKSIIFKINDDESFSINGIPSTIENYKTTLKSIFNKFEKEDSDEEIKVYVKSEDLVKWSFIEEIGKELKKYNIVNINVTSGILDNRNEKIKLNQPASPVLISADTLHFKKASYTPPTPPAPPTPPNPKVGKKPPLPFLPAKPPPAPLSDPVEYIKALHKSGAVFFIGPHQYNYERVLEMAKKTTDLNIDVSEYPKVNLLGC